MKADLSVAAHSAFPTSEPEPRASGMLSVAVGCTC